MENSVTSHQSCGNVWISWSINRTCPESITLGKTKDVTAIIPGLRICFKWLRFQPCVGGDGVIGWWLDPTVRSFMVFQPHCLQGPQELAPCGTTTNAISAVMWSCTGWQYPCGSMVRDLAREYAFINMLATTLPKCFMYGIFTYIWL